MDRMLNCRNQIELLQAGAKYLEFCGVDHARSEGDLLLAHVLETSRDQLYLQREREVPWADKVRYWEFLQRRGNREPLAYILKTREFMGLEFYVDPRVLIPRPETELLVEKTLEMVIRIESDRKVLDLCTGSGAVAVAIAHYLPGTKVIATDLSEDALTVARRNGKKNQVKVDFRQGDLFQPVTGEKFHIIVSNPPYVTEEEYTQCSLEVRKEPTLALLGGEDGLDFYRRIALEGDEYLLSGGTIILEIGNTQGSKVAALFADQGYETVVLPDYAGWDRMVLAKKE